MPLIITGRKSARETVPVGEAHDHGHTLGHSSGARPKCNRRFPRHARTRNWRAAWEAARGRFSP